MCYWSSKFHMPCSLATNLRSSHFHATSFTNYTFVADSFVFSTRTFKIFAWSKNLLTEKPTTFWALRTIVDCFRNKHLPVRKCTNIFMRRHSNTDRRKVIKIFSGSDILFPCMLADLRIISNFII